MMSPPANFYPTTFATAGLSFRGGSLQRHTKSQGESGEIHEVWHDLFSTDGDSRKFAPLVNTWMSSLHASSKGLVMEQRIVEIDCRRARVWDPCKSKRFFASHVMDGIDCNAIIEFEHKGQHLLVDFATVIQYLIAPSKRCFEALVSPLGSVAMHCESDADFTLIDLDWDAFHSLDEDLVEPERRFLTPIAPNNAQCLSFWASDPERLFELRKWYSRLVFNGEMLVPPRSLPVQTSVQGWETDDGFFIGRLMRPNGAQWWGISDAPVAVVLRGRDTGWIYSFGRHTGAAAEVISDRARFPMRADRETVNRLAHHLRERPHMKPHRKPNDHSSSVSIP